jgi:hypothetical protein
MHKLEKSFNIDDDFEPDSYDLPDENEEKKPT